MALASDTITRPLRAYLSDRLGEFGEIDSDRRHELDRLATYVRGVIHAGGTARLTFVCTHNSRRSHLAQIWAQTAAAHFEIATVETFSGGTEATAFHPNAVAAIERAGFLVDAPSGEANPQVGVRWGKNAEPMACFSKVYDQSPNPREKFAAVMVCDSADAACPFVPGADARFAIKYQDPKAFDGTDREVEAYDERCRQIARELLYAFSRVNG
ncbi:MAG: hypothetical protein RIB32_00525 [Phycisphaerales bacterium]